MPHRTVDYRQLFDSIDEGFCIIEVMVDPMGAVLLIRLQNAGRGVLEHCPQPSLAGAEFVRDGPSGFLVRLAGGDVPEEHRDMALVGVANTKRIDVVARAPAGFGITGTRPTRRLRHGQSDAPHGWSPGTNRNDVRALRAEALVLHEGDAA
jgi:hypothetical protein